MQCSDCNPFTIHTLVAHRCHFSFAGVRQAQQPSVAVDISMPRPDGKHASQAPHGTSAAAPFKRPMTRRHIPGHDLVGSCLCRATDSEIHDTSEHEIPTAMLGTTTTVLQRRHRDGSHTSSDEAGNLNIRYDQAGWFNKEILLNTIPEFMRTCPLPVVLLHAINENLKQRFQFRYTGTRIHGMRYAGACACQP